MEVLRGKEKFLGVLEAGIVATPIAGKSGETKYDTALFEILRKKRKELADAAHVPPYVIFPDKTLVEMAIYYPTSMNNMKKIFGVGSQKLVKYGQVFVEVISDYCVEHQLVEKRKKGTSRTEGKSHDERQPKHILIGEAYNAGASIHELVRQWGIHYGTILNHLSKYILEGHALRSDEFLDLPDLPAGLHQNVIDAFESLGTNYLKPIYEELGGTVNYDDLKIMRLYYLVNRNEMNRASSTNEDD
jgi:ATP-dependent DNA helicase RecQ